MMSESTPDIQPQPSSAQALADLRTELCDAHLLPGDGWVREVMRQVIGAAFYAGINWQRHATATPRRERRTA